MHDGEPKEDRPPTGGKPRSRRTQQEVESARLENAARKLELDYLRARLDHEKEIAEKRDKYAGWTFVLLCFWSAATLVIAALSSLLAISTGVTVALVSATAVQFASLLVIVLKFYFPASDDHSPFEVRPPPRKRKSH